MNTASAMAYQNINPDKYGAMPESDIAAGIRLLESAIRPVIGT
jgi:hypothetical protein